MQNLIEGFETVDLPDPIIRPKFGKVKKLITLVAVIAVISAIAYIASRPAVVEFIATARLYFSKQVQSKAWNEAKRINLEGDIQHKTEELKKVKPNSFLIREVEAQQRPEINIKVEEYLRSKQSPMADYTDVLLSQPNWKKIVALSNAESSLCRRYPVNTSNCWGIGGEKLWVLGDNLGEGIVAANNFLATYPVKGKKYQDMSIEEMNGLYKQPYGAHWSVNIYTVLMDLEKLEK